jgi:putative MFS transporter
MAETTIAAITTLSEQKLSPRQRFAAVLVAAGEFIDGYDLLVMGAALIYLRPQFNLTPSEVGLLGASTFIGAIIGLLVFGDMSDRIGRRAIFIVNLIFFVVFGILSALVTDTVQLFAMRFLVGVGVGMDIPTSTAYLAEVAPRRQRGAILGSLLNVMWVLGALVATLLALPLGAWFGDAAWRWMLGLGALPAILILIGRQLLPESPRWLVARGRTEEARAAFAAFGIAARAEDLVVRRQDGSYGDLLRPPYRRRTLWVALVFLLNCFSGSITTIAAPLVVKQVGALSVQSTLLFSASNYLTALIGVLISALLIDRIGRRPLCYLSAIPFGVLALVLAAFSANNPLVLVLGYYGITFAVWVGMAVLVWVWASELFPTHLRGRAQGICNGACRLAIACNIYLVPLALAGVGFGTYIALLSIPMFAIAVIVKLVPDFEGSQRGLEELSAA